MISKAAYMSKSQLSKVNKALEEAGYSLYPGDRTTAQPEGCKAGYVSNLLDYLAAGDASGQQQIYHIINRTLS